MPQVRASTFCLVKDAFRGICYISERAGDAHEMGSAQTPTFLLVSRHENREGVRPNGRRRGHRNLSWTWPSFAGYYWCARTADDEAIETTSSARGCPAFMGCARTADDEAIETEWRPPGQIQRDFTVRPNGRRRGHRNARKDLSRFYERLHLVLHTCFFGWPFPAATIFGCSAEFPPQLRLPDWSHLNQSALTAPPAVLLLIVSCHLLGE